MCIGESHPGPTHSDGTFVGRSAPEIDIFEAQASSVQKGRASSFANALHKRLEQISVVFPPGRFRNQVRFEVFEARELTQTS